MLARLKRMLFEGDVMRLMGMAVLVRPIGMVTQMLMASYFGAGEQYDAYVLAFFLVTFAEMGFGRVYTSVVVPYTIKLRKELDERGLRRFQIATYLLFILPGVIYATALIVRGEWFVTLAGPRAPTGTREMALAMIRMMSLPGLAMLMIVMGASTLNINKRFRVPGALPIVNSLVFLLVLLLTHEARGIWALPFAFTCGALVQLAIVIVWGYLSGTIRPALPRLPAGTAGHIWSLSWLILVATTLQTMNAFLDKMFASSLEPGSISSVMYSQTLMNFGMQIFTLSLVTVMFTRISEFLSDGDMAGCNAYIEVNIDRVLRLVVPGSLAIALTSGEIVRFLFERGAFTGEDALRTSSLLTVYMLGLPAIIVNLIVTRVFHSLQRMRAKVWLSLQFLLTNLAGNMLLVGALKVVGLAISSSFAINAHLFLSLLVLHRYRLGLGIGGYTTAILRAYAIALGTWGLMSLTGLSGVFDHLVVGRGKLGILLVGAGRMFTVLAVYYAIHAGVSARRRSLRRRIG